MLVVNEKLTVDVTCVRAMSVEEHKEIGKVDSTFVLIIYLAGVQGTPMYIADKLEVEKAMEKIIKEQKRLGLLH
jgi:hypothetical protein